MLRSSRYGADPKPFLDGDFLRDSSNPLDVYEDMNITTPAPGKGAKEDSSQPAPAPSPAPTADTDAAKNESAGTNQSAASAVQVKKANVFRQPKASDAATDANAATPQATTAAPAQATTAAPA